MIDARLDGAIGRIVLDRPEAHNALDRAAMEAFAAALDDWTGAAALRAVVVTGRGRSFCAGASLGDVGGGGWDDNPLTRLCDALEAFPVPTVAALNGGAYGGGVEIALACDFRVGVTGMRAFAPPAKLGIHYEPAGIRRAIDRLGSQAARRMFLLARDLRRRRPARDGLSRPPRRTRGAGGEGRGDDGDGRQGSRRWRCAG